jgi:glycosyltransferase involved in cell wall biosynthesis
MRVLFQSRKTLFSVFGGDTTQVLKTAEYLEKLGVSVDISTELEPCLKKYDIVHIFNLMRAQETYLQVMNAKKQEKPVALSTIYGLYTEYEREASGGLRQITANMLSPHQMEYLKIFARAVKNNEFHKGTLRVILRGYYKLLRKVVENVDIFLPNSESEMKRVMKDLPDSRGKAYVVVANAVDIGIFNINKVKISEENKKYKGCVLCVAKIDGRKNQINLVRAMKGLPFPLVLIGEPSPNHINYFKQIKKEAGDNVYILGKIKHDQLPQFYKLAKVHALISWMETPGLSSLEAGVMGCNLVITQKGDTEDYFGDLAYYCEPNNVNSIREAIIKAYNTPFNDELRYHILKNYVWEKTAGKTLEAYKKILR